MTFKIIDAMADDPCVQAHRSACARQRPDLSNKADVDVMGWLQDVETYARDFAEEYDRRRSATGFDEHAPDITDCAKRFIIAIQDACGRQDEIDSRG